MSLQRLVQNQGQLDSRGLVLDNSLQLDWQSSSLSSLGLFESREMIVAARPVKYKGRPKDILTQCPIESTSSYSFFLFWLFLSWYE